MCQLQSSIKLRGYSFALCGRSQAPPMPFTAWHSFARSLSAAEARAYALGWQQALASVAGSRNQLPSSLSLSIMGSDALHSKALTLS